MRLKSLPKWLSSVAAILCLSCQDPASPARVARVEISPGPAVLTAGAVLQLSAVAYDERGRKLDLPVAWESSDTAVVGVSEQGEISGRKPGSASVLATDGQMMAVDSVPVNDPTPPISTGSNHTCALATNGAAYCWGEGYSGQLGAPTREDQAKPVGVTGGLTLAAVSAGYQHTCALTVAGQAYCWGAGTRGVLGEGEPRQRLIPHAVSGGLEFTVIATSASGYHTCALTRGGEAWCWGAGASGQLGNGGLADVWVPARVSGVADFAAITVGETHTCALTRDARAYCWGTPAVGEAQNSATTPVEVPGNLRFASISSHFQHTCAITTAGRAFSGDRTCGESSAPAIVSGATFRAP